MLELSDKYRLLVVMHSHDSKILRANVVAYLGPTYRPLVVPFTTFTTADVYNVCNGSIR